MVFYQSWVLVQSAQMEQKEKNECQGNLQPCLSGMLFPALFPGLSAPSCSCVLPLHPPLEAQALVAPVPTSPQKEESQKKAHEAFFSSFS